MADQADVHTIIGNAFWAKILGGPQPAYNPGEKQWSIDVSLDNDGVKKMNNLGLGREVKTKGDARGIFVTFIRRELKKKTGQPNQPIRVVGVDGKDWDKSTLLGNGTNVEVKFKIYTVPAFGKSPAHQRAAILEVKVLELVPYVKKSSVQNSTQSENQGWKGDVV